MCGTPREVSGLIVMVRRSRQTQQQFQNSEKTILPVNKKNNVKPRTGRRATEWYLGRGKQCRTRRTAVAGTTHINLSTLQQGCSHPGAISPACAISPTPELMLNYLGLAFSRHPETPSDWLFIFNPDKCAPLNTTTVYGGALPRYLDDTLATCKGYRHAYMYVPHLQQLKRSGPGPPI